jgi:methionyl-tRNA formyltransferase
VGASLLLKTVSAIEQGDYPLIEQDTLLQGRESIHAPKIFKEDMKISWSHSVEQIYNQIRGLSPFPGAWTELIHCSTGKMISLKIFKTEKIVVNHSQTIGTIETDGKHEFTIFVPGGKIKILELQLSGKKRMKTDEFLRGFQLKEYKLSL